MSDSHTNFMKMAVALGKEALANGNPPVGAVIVYGDEVIGKGIESGKTTRDITNHAEIEAVRDAIQQGHADKLSQSILYTTHEPCIMCSYLIRHHRLPQVIYGVSVKDVGGYSSEFKILSTENIPKWGKKPEVTRGVLEEECQHLSRQFERQQK
ncbi:nucleoside deaminase [Rapidithrix thailandica]|uniref:Nucleoside deaminase n=1 Tax=Rapidithrix thailandica TaxID=413964 RepID=A0AAW9S712_9BACT